MWVEVLSGNYSLSKGRVARDVSSRPFCRSTILCGGRHRWIVISVSRHQLGIFGRHMMDSRMRATWKTFWDGWELQWISHLQKSSTRRASTWALQFSPIRNCPPSNIEISMQYLLIFLNCNSTMYPEIRNVLMKFTYKHVAFKYFVFVSVPKQPFMNEKTKEKPFKIHNKTFRDLCQ